MTISRRAFLASLGTGAAAVALGGVSLPAAGTVSVTATTEAAAALEQTLRVGDVFTIAGRYAMNPATRTLTPHLQQFVVTGIDGDAVTMWPKSNGRDEVSRAHVLSGIKPLHAK